MQIKVINSMNVLCFTQKTTLTEMMKYVRVVANDLHRSAIENQMEITGPVYWIYHGMDGRPETVFTLEICIPVAHSGDYAGSFALKQLPAFKCAFDVHHGSWMEMYKTYQSMMDSLHENHLSMTGIAREVYINMDFEKPENNSTEIQLGIN